VLNGSLRLFAQDANHEAALDISRGEVVAFGPDEVHGFANITSVDCEALEFYFPDVLSEDITRHTLGGVSK
jgi:mannose-6-phosphate isomerase-like protein (cupin superfamily)